MAMQAGKLRHRIIIQTTTQTQNATYGSTEDSWDTHVTAWASIEPLRVGSREWFDAQKFNAEVSHQVKLRYRSGVTPKMRISWDSRYFDIKVVLNIEERDKELNLLVKETI